MGTHQYTHRARRGAVGLGAALMTTIALAEPIVRDLGAGHYEVVFSFTPPAGSKSVHLAGTFNGWAPTATPMTGPDEAGHFTLTFPLERGRYEYKFVVDGSQWCGDSDNPHTAGSHHNAVLFVGVDPEADSHQVVPPTREVNMAARAEHAAAVRELLTKTRGQSSEAVRRVLQTWLQQHRLPVAEDGAYGFVHFAPQASSVRVAIKGRGFWTGYDMDEPVPGLFAVSLRAAEVPAGSAYQYEVQTGDRRELVVDPHAYTVSSRDGEPVAVVAAPDPTRGRIELIDRVADSHHHLQARPVYVYLPPGYDTDAGRRYPTLYLHDGQNCWDDPAEPFGHGGWQLNVTADRLIRAGTLTPLIMVGIPNTDRRRAEYGPGHDIRDAEGHAYLQYLIRDVKPLIDRRYRTVPGPASTGILGSSMGGIISLQAGLLRPDVFGMVGCLSPALYFTDDAHRTYFDLLDQTGKQPIRIYLDSGTAGSGQDGAPGTRRLGETLIAAGWVEGETLMRFEDTGAEHNERAWRARVHKALLFLFGR